MKCKQIDSLIKQRNTARKTPKISSKGRPICFWFCYSFGRPRSRGVSTPPCRFTKNFRVKFYPRDVLPSLTDVRIMPLSRNIMALAFFYIIVHYFTYCYETVFDVSALRRNTSNVVFYIYRKKYWFTYLCLNIYSCQYRISLFVSLSTTCTVFK